MRGKRPGIPILFGLCATVLFSSCSEGGTKWTEGAPSAAATAGSAVNPAQSGKELTPSFTDEDAEKVPYRIEVMAEGLNVPWELQVAEDGRIFFTERPGNLRVIAGGKLLEKPVISFPAPFVSVGEGGLLGLALDPAFADNGYIYVYHSYEQDGGIRNRVLRLYEKDSVAEVDKVLLDGIPGDTNHNGGRLKFGPDGMLYITTGERYEPELAQDKTSLGGKILRIAPDGSIPGDNPFPGSPVYSYGHRNPQGLAWQPETGRLFAVEHGQSAHDEINVIVPGGNYGWPLIEGDETGEAGGEPLRSPLLHSGEETWAPSGAAFITGGPWKGNLLVAALRGERLLRIALREQGEPAVKEVEPLFMGEWGRIRTVYEAPDGAVYLLTNNRDGRGTPQDGDDKLVRLAPRQ